MKMPVSLLRTVYLSMLVSCCGLAVTPKVEPCAIGTDGCQLLPTVKTAVPSSPVTPQAAKEDKSTVANKRLAVREWKEPERTVVQRLERDKAMVDSICKNKDFGTDVGGRRSTLTAKRTAKRSASARLLTV